ncbi:MAG: hypothetical protein ACM3ZF_14475 [Mycobacterium leprae]
MSGKLADQWIARLLTPGLVFWATGLLAWSWSVRPAHARGHGFLLDLGHAIQHRMDVFSRMPGAQQLAWLVAGLVAIAGSTVLIERLTSPFLRWLEGYWPNNQPRWLWNRFTQLARWRRRRMRQEWGRLRQQTNNTPHDRTREGVLAGRLHSMPPEEYFMPSLLGNVLRASELRTGRRYGIDPVIAWPRLWPLLPEPAREDITGSRSRLDTAGRAVLWALAATVWSAFVWWIGPVTVLLAYLIYRASALPAARIYADLVEAAFDVHRPSLYKALRLPPPEAPSDEPAAGQVLTKYLWGGDATSMKRFTDVDRTPDYGAGLRPAVDLELHLHPAFVLVPEWALLRDRPTDDP